ncbi:MAG TPA: hypothetical protein VGL80_30185, partial [Pseudonocardiaceae bacterium]
MWQWVSTGIPTTDAVYRSGDGRGRYLFDLVRQAAPDDERLVVAEAVLAELRARGLPEMNI